jgi:bifunctional enzyme CysN/CysC
MHSKNDQPSPVATLQRNTETPYPLQPDRPAMRLITCGSIGAGKSSLIARLLQDAQQQRLNDPLTSRQPNSKSLSAPVDSIVATHSIERSAAKPPQTASPSMLHQVFHSRQRKFMVTDIANDQACTHNILLGAQGSDVAVLLVDASQGILSQTRQHALLASLSGIRHLLLAINKFDLVEYAQDTFIGTQGAFASFAKTLGFESITAIPVSALKGDNISQRSMNTPWYCGPSLLEHLDAIELKQQSPQQLAFLLDQTNPDASSRELSGSVAQGQLKIGDDIRVTASGQTARVERIINIDGNLPQAEQNSAVTLMLDKPVNAAYGDILSLASQPLETTDQFEANLIWLSQEPGLIGRTYELKLATQHLSASLTGIKHRIDINSLAHEAVTKLELNDISLCNLATSKGIAFDTFAQSKALGSFSLVDCQNKATVAIGMLNHSLRRAQNVHRQALSLTRQDREKHNGHKGKVIWFTGLSGSGKSTLANALEVELHARGYRTYILDGDNIRQGLNKDLGFTDADRVENIRRIAEVAKLMMDAGLIVMTAFISPFRRERQMARELIGDDSFVEVYVSTTLEVCEKRDVKGLYKKARSGQLPNLSGVGSAYEPPITADFEINAERTELNMAIVQLMEAIDAN